MPDSSDQSEKSSPATPPAPRLTLPYRAERPAIGGRFGAWARTWSRNNFSRDQVMNGLRSLLWVAPLTVLIWIYAEREQLATAPNVKVPVEVVSSDPNFIISLANTEQPWVTVTLSGPHAQLDTAREKVEYSGNNLPVRVEVNPAVGAGRQRIPASRLGNDSRFVTNGVTVSNPQPEWLEIIIDPIQERDIPIKQPDDFKTLVEPAFEPKTVHIRGPSRVLDDLVAKGPLVAYAQLANHPDLKPQTGEAAQTLRNVKVRLPTNDKNVTIVGGRDTTTATITLARPEEGFLESMPVFVTGPIDLLNAYQVEYLPPVKNVSVIGPKEEIQKLTRKDVDPPVVALEIPRNITTAGTYSGQLRYDLPKGVEVKDLGKPGGPPVKLEFTLTKR